MRLKRVGIISVGITLGCIYGALGLILGAFFTLFALLGAAVSSAGGTGGGVEALFVGAGAVVFFPVIYGVMGLIGGMLMAAVYNIVASITGGIEMEFDQPAVAAPPMM